MRKAKKKKRIYKLIGIGDTVLVPCSKDVYRKATVIDTHIKNDTLALRIQFDNGSIHFISSELCYRIVRGVAIPLEQPKTKIQKFSIWLLRKFGLSEV